MKQHVELPEMDYYRDYLRGHLRDHRFPRYTNKKFIEARAEEAYDRLITLHLEDHSVAYANEMAMRTLLAGLYVSRYDIIYNVVEENLWLRLPPELYTVFSEHLLTFKEIHAVLDKYDVNGDFLDRETHQPMLTELLGIISEIMDGYEF